MHPKSSLSHAVYLAIACGSTILVNSSAQASGFAIPEMNITGLGTSNALVANPDSLGAISYNPAAMSFHEGGHINLGTLLIQPDLAVDTGSGTTDSDANDLVVAPAISAHDQLNEDWALGIAINAPFGLETKWNTEVYGNQYPVGSFMPTTTKLEIAAFSPSLAYKVNDQASLAFGVDYYWMKKVEFNSAMNDGGNYPGFNLEGDGRSVGLNLGAMLVLDKWSFGASFHSVSKIKAKGTLDDEVGVLPSNSSDRVTATLELPWRFQIGARYQVMEKLGVEFDFTRTGWRTFDELVVKNEEYGSTIFTSKNYFENANAYRLGITYDFTPATQLRIGYSLDETPQTDEYFSPRIPDADRQLFSLGIGHSFADGWSVEVGYMYTQFDDRTIDSDKQAVASEELNGTTAVNGSYESSVQLFGMGITKTFK
jgi:long-chain fatty acid transport protein